MPKPARRKCPPRLRRVSAIFAACGKVKSTTQLPLIPGMPTKPVVDPEATKAASDLRALMQGVQGQDAGDRGVREAAARSSLQ